MGFGYSKLPSSGGSTGDGIPAWDSTTKFAINSIVTYKGLLYRAILTNLNCKPTTSLTTWEHLGAPTAWSPTASYKVNSVVGYSNKVYICLIQDRGNPPDISPTIWKELSIGAKPGVRAWDNSTLYNVNDLISYSGKIYKVTTANTNSRPDSCPAYYSEYGAGGGTTTTPSFKGNYIADIAYNKGDIVYYAAADSFYRVLQDCTPTVTNPKDNPTQFRLFAPDQYRQTIDFIMVNPQDNECTPCYIIPRNLSIKTVKIYTTNNGVEAAPTAPVEFELRTMNPDGTGSTIGNTFQHSTAKTVTAGGVAYYEDHRIFLKINGPANGMKHVTFQCLVAFPWE